MATKGEIEFKEWVEENNIDYQDFELIRKTTAKRAWIYFLLSHCGMFYITLPFFLREWEWYKMIKQRTFSPRLGLWFSLYKLAMVITFIMIIPFILCRVFYNGTKLSGISFLINNGFIGEGDQGRKNYDKYKQIKKRPAKIRNLVCVILSVVLAAIIGLLLGTYFADQWSADIDSLGAFVAIFITSLPMIFIDCEIAGLIITKLVANKKYKQWHNSNTI